MPAQELVGGDFFFVGEGPESATIVVVGDVVGKGLEAARRAAFVRAAIAACASYEDDPCRLLEFANGALVGRAGASDTFVTAVSLVHRPSRRTISWALAGHPAPMLLDTGESLDDMSPGLPLGLDREFECAKAERRLAPGEGIVLFTDGLTEARRAPDPQGGAANGGGGELFGGERVGSVLAEQRDGSAADVVEALRSAAERFAGGGLADDLCVVAARVH